MKNKTYIVGIATVIAVTIGCLFKIMHWPGAGILITLGLVCVSVVFIPMAFISSFKNESNKKLKPLYILTAIVFALNILSALFKIMHWPMSGTLLIITIPLPFVVLLPAFLIYNKNDQEINYKNFMPIMFFFAYFAAISALLVLGVSKEVLDEYGKSAKAYTEKTLVLTQECNTIIEKLQKDSLVNTKVKKQVLLISEKSNKIQTLIENLKINNINSEGGNINNSVFANNAINLEAIRNKDRGIISNPAFGFEIAKELSELKSLLIDLQHIKKQTETFADKTIVPNLQDEESYAYLGNNRLLIANISDLCLLQYQVRLTEYIYLLK